MINAPISNKALIVKRWILPLVGGCLGGPSLGWACAWLSRLAVGTDDLADIGPILLGLISGYVLGVTLGTFYTLKVLKQKASFWRALLGSVLGGVLLMILAFLLGLDSYPTLMSGLIITLAPVLSLALNQQK